jgi:hypothetical protein
MSTVTNSRRIRCTQSDLLVPSFRSCFSCDFSPVRKMDIRKVHSAAAASTPRY